MLIGKNAGFANNMMIRVNCIQRSVVIPHITGGVVMSIKIIEKQEERLCTNCAYKSDGLNTRTPDYCYCHDMQVERDGICSDWRGSLRASPLNDPPPLKEDT